MRQGQVPPFVRLGDFEPACHSVSSNQPCLRGRKHSRVRDAVAWILYDPLKHLYSSWTPASPGLDLAVPVAKCKDPCTSATGPHSGPRSPRYRRWSCVESLFCFLSRAVLHVLVETAMSLRCATADGRDGGGQAATPAPGFLADTYVALRMHFSTLKRCQSLSKQIASESSVALP